MLKFQKTPTSFGPQKDHPQGVRQALLKLPLCTINMYAYVGDVVSDITVRNTYLHEDTDIT